MSKIRRSTFLFTLFAIFLFLTSGLCITLLFLFLKEKGIMMFGRKNISQISIPKKDLSNNNNLVMYDLFLSTYDDDSLLRLEKRKVIKMSKNSYFPTSAVIENVNGNLESGDESTVIHILPTGENWDEEEEMEVEVQGICECYEEEEEEEEEGQERRGITNLVFQHRYSSTVVVSVLAYAASKFVNNHIDDCYDEAKRVLGHNNDESRSTIRSLSCSMNDVYYEAKRRGVVKGGQGKVVNFEEIKDRPFNRMKGDIYFDCEGHCVLKEILYRWEGKVTKIQREEARCEEKWLKETKIRINDASWFQFQQMDDYMYPYSVPVGYLSDAAKLKFEIRFLRDFCRKEKQHFVADTGKTRVFHPCLSKDEWDKFDVMSNIECTYNVEESEFETWFEDLPEGYFGG